MGCAQGQGEHGGGSGWSSSCSRSSMSTCSLARLGTMRIVACITQPSVIERIVTHLRSRASGAQVTPPPARRSSRGSGHRRKHDRPRLNGLSRENNATDSGCLRAHEVAVRPTASPCVCAPQAPPQTRDSPAPSDAAATDTLTRPSPTRSASCLHLTPQRRGQHLAAERTAAGGIS